MKVDGVEYSYIGRCLCGGEVHACADDPKTSGVVHSLPTCPAFDSHDPADYVTWLRRGKGIPDSMVEAH